MKSTSLLSLFSGIGFTIALPQFSQISDGQPQAPTAVSQISDGQIQATATAVSGSGASPGAGAPTVVTRNGTYQGFHLDTYNEDLFLGIPYAQPPLGPLRFTIPQSINTTFDGVRQATEYYPACVGYGGDDIGYAESEDCLAINVIRPSGYEGQALPVGLWIHGGGLIMGSGGDHRYNLSFIVQNSAEIGMPIIGVSINYRLAGWGFLASLQVLASGQTNLGLRDQRLAMAWVQENIAAFGGDPTKVTIWGESSGAASVGYHLTAYGGRDDKLFRAGIMESGGPFNTFQSDTYYQPRYDFIVNATGCNDQIDTLNCLRYLPFDQLNAVLNTTMFNGTDGSFDPILDGDLLQSFGSLQLAAGKFVHVPIIDGANTDEGTAFGPKGIQNASQFQSYLESPLQATGVALPEFFAAEILQAYPDDPALGIPSASEIGDIRLNATYGPSTTPFSPSAPLSHPTNPSLRLRIPPHLRLCGRRRLHREPPPHLLDLRLRQPAHLLLPLQHDPQRHQLGDRRHPLPRSRLRLQ